ncbi:response regulator [Tundrisphaera lichenicola]|uniref:response regulator n=1 Tax=Tundrisphaera lichenicola TaxID=2029860 RepID=UPI003EBE7AF5
MSKFFDAFRSAVDRASWEERTRILIVEDNNDLARVIAMLLRHCGFDVKTTHDGRLVLAVARAFRPRYILMDIGLPGMDGARVAEQLRQDQEFEDTLIIAISTYGPHEHPAITRSAQFDHHLTKPFSLEDLLSVLRSA